MTLEDVTAYILAMKNEIFLSVSFPLKRYGRDSGH